MDSNSGASNGEQHLCVLVHGLWGNPGHLDSMAKSLRAKHSEDTLHILIPKSNSGNATYDGIERGGERVCSEIEEEMERLARAGRTITRLSMVGYSLGGLVARYSIGILHSKGLFDTVTPVNFTTFASPHLGVRTPLLGWHSHLWNILGARTLSASGRQLFTIDNFRDTGKPLLEVLADPESIFIKGLAQFQRRTLYANITNDRTAVYYTTGISKTDPFTDIDKVKITYLKGYEDVIIDPTAPVVLRGPEDLGFYGRFAKECRKIFGRIPLILALMIFIPIGSVVFLVNSGIQSFRSSRRIRLHENGLAGIQTGSYRVPLLIKGVVQEVVQDAYGNLNHSQSNEYLTTGSEVDAQINGQSSSEGESSEQAEAQESAPLKSSEKHGTSEHHFPTLALAPYQFRIIDALDNLGWRKYPVHIHKVMHSHAAIVVRIQKDGYSEGHQIFRHWLDEEFIL